MYREFFKPRHARMWRRAKELADVKVMLHCCGGVRPLLPDLIDAGLDAINPVQISCKGMEAAGLKRDFGETSPSGAAVATRRWSLRTPHPRRSANTSRSRSKSCAGRRLRLPAGAQYSADVPPENIVAMLEAVKSCR